MASDIDTIREKQEQTTSLSVETITQDRRVLVAYLFGCLAFLAVFIAAQFYPSPILHDKDPGSLMSFLTWLVVPFSILGGMVFIVRLFRPPTLTLDPDGFSLAGGERRASKKWLGREIEPFFLLRVSSFNTVIASNLRPECRPTKPIGGLNLGRPADIMFAGGWSLLQDDLLERLNEYRNRALGLKASEQDIRSDQWTRRDLEA